jgi:hypothetical protein
MVGKGAEREFVVSDDYGEWIDHKVKVKFGAHPKRDCILESGRMKPWGYFDWESEPYRAAMKGPEALAIMQAEIIALEQPDADLGNLDTDDTRGMQ